MLFNSPSHRRSPVSIAHPTGLSYFLAGHHLQQRVAPSMPHRAVPTCCRLYPRSSDVMPYLPTMPVVCGFGDASTISSAPTVESRSPHLTSFYVYGEDRTQQSQHAKSVTLTALHQWWPTTPLLSCGAVPAGSPPRSASELPGLTQVPI
jgi:hypothetical protein